MSIWRSCSARRCRQNWDADQRCPKTDHPKLKPHIWAIARTTSWLRTAKGSTAIAGGTNKAHGNKKKTCQIRDLELAQRERHEPEHKQHDDLQPVNLCRGISNVAHFKSTTTLRVIRTAATAMTTIRDTRETSSFGWPNKTTTTRERSFLRTVCLRARTCVAALRSGDIGAAKRL